MVLNNSVRYGWRQYLFDCSFAVIAFLFLVPVFMIARTKEKILSVIYWTGVHVSEAWEHLVLALHGKRI